MIFPSRVGGPTTQEVGFFAIDHVRLADWITEGLGSGSARLNPRWQSVEDALEALQPSPVLSRYACVALKNWTLLLNNGPTGTDVGVLASHAARELDCRAIRAVRVDDDEPGYPARILEVYGPQGKPPLVLERSVTAANDGGRWVFETSGTAFAFENEAAYGKRCKSNRFTGEMLHGYLVALAVPVDVTPDWRTAMLIERRSRRLVRSGRAPRLSSVEKGKDVAQDYYAEARRIAQSLAREDDEIRGQAGH